MKQRVVFFYFGVKRVMSRAMWVCWFGVRIGVRIGIELALSWCSCYLNRCIYMSISSRIYLCCMICRVIVATCIVSSYLLSSISPVWMSDIIWSYTLFCYDTYVRCCIMSKPTHRTHHICIFLSYTPNDQYRTCKINPIQIQERKFLKEHLMIKSN